MDYRQALDYLSSFADFERAPSERLQYRTFNLERVRALLALVGDPHLAVPSVHVAGTKGKGSTVAMVASVLQAAGLRVGVYTSPHLHTIRERIAVNGEAISEEQFAWQVERLGAAVSQVNKGEWGQLTVFELLTAMAFLYFRDAGAVFNVLEVGLGGRLDATNVVMPHVCGITNISLDHTEVLGDTLAAIAGEKAGIIKPNAPVVSAPQPAEALEVVERVAREKGSPLTLVGRDVAWAPESATVDGQSFTVATPRSRYHLWTPLLGEHQAENAAVAVAICERLAERGVAVAEEAVRQGIARVRWPGRLEVLCHRPLVVVDGAHNPYSIRRVVEAVKKHFQFKRAIVVFGATGSKDIAGMVRELASLGAHRAITTRSRHPKAAQPEATAQGMNARGILAEPAQDTAAAVARALELAGPGDLVFVTGSLFVVAEAREALGLAQPEPHEWVAKARV